MKRIYIGLLFAAAVVGANRLSGDTESGGTDPTLRVLLTAVIAAMVLWKLADFWQRHRNQNDAATGDPEGRASRSDYPG